MAIILRAPPPPPHTHTDNGKVCDQNAMQAFPQEKISHYTSDTPLCMPTYSINFNIITSASSLCWYPCIRLHIVYDIHDLMLNMDLEPAG